MDSVNRRQIADRIRALIAAEEGGSLAAAARELRVDLRSLHMSVDTDAPYPTIDVIAAVIREYGVDPCWLLTGAYDSTTHRSVLGAKTDEMPAVVTSLVQRLSGEYGEFGQSPGLH